MIRKEKTDNLKSLFFLNSVFNKKRGLIVDDQINGCDQRYVQYSSAKAVFKILSSDSILAFNSELSNDLSENKLIQSEKQDDVYISCFYCDHRSKKPGDVYSQWTSYCQDGGAAIEYYFGQDTVFEILKDKSGNPNNDDFYSKVEDLVDNIGMRKRTFDYSIMAGEKDEDSEYILYPQFPFLVSYYSNIETNSYKLNTSNPYFANLLPTIENIKTINEEKGMTPFGIYDYAPYIKHEGFSQEKEARLAFVNRNNSLSKCIRFLGENMIPYICLRFGNRDDINGPCGLLDAYEGDSIDEKAEKYINSIPFFRKNSSFPIVIPQGRNQEEVFNAIEKCVLKYNKDRLPENRLVIICKGHLPITKITLAPTNDRELQRKKLEIFCKSKYWLRNVEVCTSSLPYNMFNMNHT